MVGKQLLQNYNEPQYGRRTDGRPEHQRRLDHRKQRGLVDAGTQTDSFQLTTAGPAENISFAVTEPPPQPPAPH